MGLDMYAYTSRREDLVDPQAQTDLELKPDAKPGELHYWRKLNALHGWMRSLYRDKGGKDLDFNCNTVRLDPADLDRLEAEMYDLKPKPGFFFGPQEFTADDVDRDVKPFLVKAREAHAAGLVVFYDSWW
jgi:hypothetical protein